MLTYGDGLSNVNLNNLLRHHTKHKKIATVTAVHPPARFGQISIKSDKVKEFSEKRSEKSMDKWRFFASEPEVLNYISETKHIRS